MNIPTSLFFFCYFFFFFWLIYLFQFADASPSDKNKSLLTNTNRAISRLLLQTLPTIGKDILKFILGNSAYESLRRGCHYVLYERNPLLQLLYIGIINGAYAFWLLLGQPLLPTLFVPNYHKSVILAGIVFCQYLFYLACTTAPGQITQDTEEEYDRRYPYDGTVFVKGLSCETCAVRKVARSKHCRLCDKCVPRFDHHCIWLNQCIGANNHKYFLSFLLFHAIFLSYCSYVSSAVLLSEVVEKRLFQATFLNKRTNKINKATHWVVLKYLIYHHYGIIIIFGLVFVMAIAMIFFLGYHLHLVRKGTTTNETGKWEDAKLAYHELKHRYEQYTRGAKSSEEVKHVLVHDMMDSETASAAEAKDLETVQMTPCGAFLRGYSWKERVIAEDDDSETTSAKESRNYYPDPGDEPQNIYNRGFFANMSDIIWPLVISDTGRKKNPKASKKNK